MRFSDWKSDVCSSDLVDKSGNTHGRGLLQFAKPRKLHGSAVIRINLHIIGRLEKHTEFRCEAVEIRLAAPLGIQAIFDLPLTAGMNTADDQSETIDGLDAELAIAVDGARRLTGVWCKSAAGATGRERGCQYV